MSGSGRYIPVELVENIFEELRPEGWEDLKRCALASRVYLALSRKILFRSVTIILEALDNEERRSLFQFLTFLASHSQISACIRELKIRQSDASYKSRRRLDWVTTAMKLAEILPGLTSLRHLKVDFSLKERHKDGGMREVLVRFFNIPTLRHLELYLVSSTTEELLGLLRIPKLTLLAIHVPSFDPSVVPLPDLHAIQLCDLTIDLSIPEAERAEVMFNVARAACATLKSLTWTSCPLMVHKAPAHPGTAFLHVIDLRALPSLTFLSISTYLNPENINELSKMLERIARSKLEVLEIVCESYSIYQPDLISTLEWNRLEAALMSPSHSALQKVRISVKNDNIFRYLVKKDYGDSCHDALSLFESKLPILRDKGMIYGHSDAQRDSKRLPGVSSLAIAAH